MSAWTDRDPVMSALVAIRPGTYSTIQDGGRPGYRGVGVPPAGAFDRESLAIANALLGNPADAPALELTLYGGTYRARGSLALALAGAALRATIEAPDGSSRTLEPPCSMTAIDGSILRIGGASRGARAYLATRGGFSTTSVLGSASSEEPIAANTELLANPSTCPNCRIAAGLVRPLGLSGPIRVLDGPDAGVTESAAIEGLIYRVGPLADRVGLRLEGPEWPGIATTEAGRTSTPLGPGAIQIAGGRPIVLGVACGTMGGYLHVAQVISADLDRLGQLRPGDPVQFRRVALNEARRLDVAHRRRVARLATRVAAAAGASIDRSRPTGWSVLSAD